MSMAPRINSRAARLGLGKLEAGCVVCACDAVLGRSAKLALSPTNRPTKFRLVMLDNCLLPASQMSKCNDGRFWKTPAAASKNRIFSLENLKLETHVQAYGVLTSDLVVVGTIDRRIEHRVRCHHRVAIQRIADGAEQANLLGQIV